ncbi:MAG: methyltransferase [Alphaproteobacteria bacterium]|nr:MAG: methyltransferase [Alphaproteobacteria bacterium]
MDLKEEDILGDKIHGHWYYVSKGKAMRSFLGNIKANEVLDVGAGSGIFSRQLLDHNICQSAVCVDPNYAEEKEESQNGKSIKFVKSIDKTTQGLTLMMDVLEHVEDDVALLKEYADTMPEDGKILITVPAFQFMWSGHDVFLEHYRRYTIEMMEKTIRDAGLRPVKSRYFFGALFPVVAVVRFVKKILFNQGKIEGKSELKLYSDGVNNTLIALHDIERVSLFSFNKLFGLSVFCLCEKV